MLKKLLTWLTVVIIACSMMTTSVYADSSNEGTFNARFTSSVDYTTSKWMSSGFNRAALTFMVYMDFILETEYETSAKFLHEPSYVMRSGAHILLCIPHESGYVVIDFTAQKPEKTAYTVHEDTSSQVIKLALTRMDDDYYENDTDDLYDVFEMLQDLIN